MARKHAVVDDDPRNEGYRRFDDSGSGFGIIFFIILTVTGGLLFFNWDWIGSKSEAAYTAPISRPAPFERPATPAETTGSGQGR